ncbi:acetylhydrolase [Paenibacillus silvae]|uniref:alpha/beta hydrolase n=1 Tax=Paenibacillus silvae TaxID=1325358 RepID=UPI0025A15584|nr:acetylhydrolase [Paenibacillus silvae]MDM5277584.1 acetylhydrolase [Paenibacillus silvae]
MRNIEMVLFIVNMILLFVCAFLPLPKKALLQTIGAGISMISAGIQILVEGYRWQNIALYGSALIIGLMAFQSYRVRKSGQPIQKSSISKTRTWLKQVIIVLALAVYIGAAAILPTILPVFAFSEPTGSFPVGTTTLFMEDVTRGEPATDDPDDHRKLMVQIWYPAEASSEVPDADYIENVPVVLSGIREAMSLPPFLLSQLRYVKTHAYTDAKISSAQERFPLLLFSPGLTGFRNQNTFQVEELASQGYIVVGIDHPYDAAAVIYPDQTTALLKLEGLSGFEDYKTKMSYWVDDTKFVLDQIEAMSSSAKSGIFSAKVDMNQVGVFGHSFGGAAAAQMLMKDSRIQAALNMDGVLYGDSVPERGFNKPYLQMNAAQSIDYEWFAQSLDQAVEATGYDRKHYERFWAESQERRKRAAVGKDAYFVVFDHANHMSFTDFYLFSPLLPPGGAEPRRVQTCINELSIAFFDKYLKGKQEIHMEEFIKDRNNITLQKP